MQRKVETAVFDKAVREKDKRWKGYAKYQWDKDYLNETKEGLTILERLDSLDLSENALLRIPAEVQECPNLKHLNLLENPEIDWSGLDGIQVPSIYVTVDSLPAIASKHWGKVTGIDLSERKLRRIPEEVLNQTQLTYLNLRQNQLTTLPPEIGQLQNLTKLDLGKNPDLDFADAFEKIGELKNLTELYLFDNQLTALPPQIKNLQQLKILFLRCNNFSEAERKKIREWLPNCEIEFY